MYQLIKDGVEYIVHVVHHMKTNIYLVFASQMKWLANVGKNFFLMIVKEKDVGKHEYFKGCDPKLKNEFAKLVSGYDIFFQERKGLSPKREIQHDIHL